MKRTTVLLIGFLFLFVSTQWAGGAPKKQEVAIQLVEFAFKPNKITLTKGVPVELKLSNKGSVTHEFMVYAPPKAGMVHGGPGEVGDGEVLLQGP